MEVQEERMMMKEAFNRYGEKGFVFGKGLGVGIGISMGIAIGAVFGFATDNLGVGVAYGLIAGIVIGAVVDSAARRSSN